MRHSTTIGALAAVSLLAVSCNERAESERETVTATSSPVETAPNDAFVSLTGTVVEASPESFLLDYGPGYITVEMDHADWVSEGNVLLEDDQVVVHGYIDDAFYERRTLEAMSVYVESLGTQFFAAGVDTQGNAMLVTEYDPLEPEINLTGTVARIDGDMFELKTGEGVVRVDTSLLLYDPLDDEGYQQVEEGDRVRVSGELEPALFDDQDLAASRVVTLQSREPDS